MARPRQQPPPAAAILWCATAAAASALALVATKPLPTAECFTASTITNSASFLSTRQRRFVSNDFDLDLAHRRHGSTPAPLSMVSSYSEQVKRRRVTIPLIDLSSESDSSLKETVIVPLPSSHLPEELTTLSVYGFEVSAPVHKMMVQNALSRGLGGGGGGEMGGGSESCYGHVVQLNPAPDGDRDGDGDGDDDDGEDGDGGNEDEAGDEEVHPLVGAVGCAAEVLLAGTVATDVDLPPPAVPGTEGMEGISLEALVFEDESPQIGGGGGGSKEDDEKGAAKEEAAGPGEEQQTTEDDDSSSPPLLVLARGSYRFVVREVIQTFPYAVGIVDELLDEEPVAPVRAEEEDDDDEEDDEDDDDDDWYLDLTPAELVQRTLQTMKVLVKQRLDSSHTKPPPTPLEVSILQDAGLPIESAAAKRTQAEEMAAVLDVFSSSLLDFAVTPIDRYYAIGLMGAELADVDNDVRKRLLVTRDGAARLRIVLREVERKISMASTKKMTEEIEEKEGGGEELQVGTPSLPSWAKQIKKGTKVEYFWNEDEGWCPGYVSSEPVMIVDELIIAVTFDSDGTVHKLPFTGDEKVRWRPAGSGDRE